MKNLINEETLHPAHPYAQLEWDATLLQYYAPYRWYHPRLSRWTTRDPLGMVDGPNVYAYVMGDPVNKVDPGGTSSEWGNWKDWFWRPGKGNEHGNPHWDVFKGGKKKGFFRGRLKTNGDPLPHKGKVPTIPKSVVKRIVKGLGILGPIIGILFDCEDLDAAMPPPPLGYEYDEDWNLVPYPDSPYLQPDYRPDWGGYA